MSFFTFRQLKKAQPPLRVAAGVFTLILLVPAIVTLWPLDALEIREHATDGGSGMVVAHTPALLGRTVANTIIHSVQLTPVIDEYRIHEGRIWAWRETIQSHNAGLPSLKPERGRFVVDSPWMIVEGGGQSWKRIVYRVGTEEFGRNVLCLSPFPCRELWREMPGKRLIFEVVPAVL